MFVLVGDHSCAFGGKMSENDEDDDNDIRNEEGVAFFNSLWLPGSDSRTKHPKEEEKKKKKKKKRRKEAQEEATLDEDVVEDLILSSDDEEYEEDDEDMSLPGVDGKAELASPKRQGKKRKPSELVYGKKSNDVIVIFWEGKLQAFLLRSSEVRSLYWITCSDQLLDHLFDCCLS
ncbi:unnamed protein product [Camellia sinensis]